MPTLCGLVGYEAKKDLKWDGRDVWKAIKGEEPASSRLLYWKGTGGRGAAVRDGDWKLIVEKDGKGGEELFDLSKDPYEKENLAAKSSEKVAQLKKLMKELASRDNDCAVREEK